MFARWRVEVLVLLVCVAKSASTDDGREFPPVQQLSQVDAEITLRTQTTLRRHFIESLANLRDKILPGTPFHSIVDGILQGLHSRDLDPLKSFANGYRINSTHSPSYRMATVIYSMQGCNSQQTTLADWHSFLQTIPDINDIVPPPPPCVHPLPHHLHDANAPYVALLAIHHNRLRPTKQLLGDILYNYPFKNHSPDLNAAIAIFIRMLHASEPLPRTFRPSPASIESPDDILSDILKFLQQQPGLAFRTTQLLSALSNTANVGHLPASTPWELLQLVRDDDYPPDIVRAAVEVAAAVRSKQVSVDAESLTGYPPQEKLLGLISQLSGEPTSEKVRAIYPHVKLRYLSGKGQFFRPRTASDVAFLLDSFLTVCNPLLIGEIHKIFLLPHFDWKTILGKFDYSKYSKPRSLLADMLQELLQNSNNLPACDLILLSYFLRNNSKVPACAAREVNDGVLIQNLGSRTTPRPTATPPNPETTAVQCSDGAPVDLVDPNSITEIFALNHDTTFISDIIRFNPMPADRYPNTTRLAVYQTAMNHLRTARYNDSVTALVIEQALARVPLNEKAHLPPSYLRLCPSQVADLQSKLPVAAAESEGWNPPSTVTDVIDPDSLLEITEGTNVRQVQQLLSLPAREYLGDRRDINACRDGETAVAVFNTDTIFNALGPNAPAAPQVRARIRALVIPVDVSKKLTKAEVLRDVLTRLEGDVHESEIRTVATALKENILSNGSGAEDPDVIRVCMSDSVVEDIRQHRTGQQSTPPTAPAVVTASQPQKVPTASFSSQSVTPLTTAASTLSVSASTSTTLSVPFTADASTAPSRPSFPPPAEVTATVSPQTSSSSSLPTMTAITTASPTSSSSLSDAIYMSFFSPGSSAAPTAVPSRFPQNTPPTLFATSSHPSSPLSTARPPAAATSILSRRRLSINAASLPSSSTSPAAGAIASSSVLPIGETKLMPDEEGRG